MKKATYFAQIFPAPSGATFRRNSEMKNTMMSRIHLYRESEEEQMRREYTVEERFIGGKLPQYDQCNVPV